MCGKFVMETDAKEYCIGRVLQQDQGHRLQPIAYCSQKLTGAPCNYTTYEQELMTIMVTEKK